MKVSDTLSQDYVELPPDAILSRNVAAIEKFPMPIQ